MEEEPVTPSTSEQDEAPASEGLGPRELMLIAGALVGSGVLMIGALSARGTVTSAAEAPRATPPAAAASVPEKPLAPSAGWIESSETWTGGAKKSAAFELPARNETHVWMKTVRPLLVVRCSAGTIEAFVFTDSPAAMEPQGEDHTVRLSLDGDPGRTERWPDSSAHDALFAPDGAAFTAQLLTAGTLRFGYTPHNASPVVAHFDVTGLREKMSPAKACAAK